MRIFILLPKRFVNYSRTTTLSFQKIIFIATHGFTHGGIGGMDFLHILYHGLSMDMSVSGYLTAIPFLLLFMSVWPHIKFPVKIVDIYFGSGVNNSFDFVQQLTKI